MYKRHPSAWVDGEQFHAGPSGLSQVDENIGEGTRIWHFCHIMKGAVIGKDCVLGQNVFVAATAKIGNNVKIQNNVSIYDGVVLEDDVFVGPSAVFTNVINPRSEVIRKDEYKETIVMRGATIGANATIVCGNLIGAHAFVAAGAVVTKSVAPFALVTGVPAKWSGWMCRCGNRLRYGGLPNHFRCAHCERCYVSQLDEQNNFHLVPQRNDDR